MNINIEASIFEMGQSEGSKTASILVDCVLEGDGADDVQDRFCLGLVTASRGGYLTYCY